jgi:hypothetical protein
MDSIAARMKATYQADLNRFGMRCCNQSLPQTLSALQVTMRTAALCSFNCRSTRHMYSQQVSQTDPLTFFFACKSLAISSGIACKTPVAISSIMLAQGWLVCYCSKGNLEQLRVSEICALSKSSSGEAPEKELQPRKTSFSNCKNVICGNSTGSVFLGVFLYELRDTKLSIKRCEIEQHHNIEQRNAEK